MAGFRRTAPRRYRVAKKKNRAPGDRPPRLRPRPPPFAAAGQFPAPLARRCGKTSRTQTATGSQRVDTTERSGRAPAMRTEQWGKGDAPAHTRSKPHGVETTHQSQWGTVNSPPLRLTCPAPPPPPPLSVGAPRPPARRHQETAADDRDARGPRGRGRGSRPTAEPLPIPIVVSHARQGGRGARPTPTSLPAQRST